MEEDSPIEVREISILVASRFDEDFISLLRILDRTNCNLSWYPTLADAVEALNRRTVYVVICSRELPDGNWKDMLRALSSLDNPPPLIVIDQFASERFCAEVSNAGGYDVLARPFDSEEVMTAVVWAWEWWALNSRRGAAAPAAQAAEGS